MPELPEVHVMKNRLNKYVKGKIILQARSFVEKSIKTHSQSAFSNNLNNQKIVKIKSYAKYLVFELTDYWMVTHQRMEGKFTIDSDDTHAIFRLKFDDQTTLHFKDHRKFATVELYSKDIEYRELPFFSKVGKLPWESNANLLKKTTSKKTVAIKSTLLDQKYIAGLGNIYVDEVLFATKILPTKNTKDITLEQWELIIEESTRILKLGIKKGGASIRTYSALDKPGKMQDELKVHTKEGSICPNGNKVKKIKVNGRGTYYCPGWQK